MDWGQRTLLNGQIVGEATKPETTITELLNQKWMACFVKRYLGLQRLGMSLW